ncbi:MAG TPA: discoidin domain-containing protein [Bacteroidales bacterium]|nr:discoidin domain-containing protein [Bacteroidales bacterium]
MKYSTIILSVLLVLTGFTTRAQVNPDNLLNHNGQHLFLSGMNLAWLNFANDLDNFDETLFTQRMDNLSEAGGNTLRWWLHTNGANNPEFDQNGLVSGIAPNNLVNLQTALDIAYERGISIILCLWSFDMLQNNAGSANWPRNKALIENLTNTQAYIDNALVPMVEAVKGHPGIVAWEIFNEPEGMNSDVDWAGWTPETTTTRNIQQFINLTAGAIHRADPEAKVSNGSWNIMVLSDVGSFSNDYTDAKLIAAGGDIDGTLDFYMVHYYPEHFGTSMSPFHNPASHWNLDKPVVIGEFSAKGISTPNGGGSTLTPEEAYAYAIENGYAGALSWTMSGHDGHGDITDARQAMLNLQSDYPDYINAEANPDYEYPPYVANSIDHFFVASSETNTTSTVVNLNEVFASGTEGMTLQYEVMSNSDDNLIRPFIDGDVLKLELYANQTGMSKVTLKALDTNDRSASTTFMVSLYDSGSEDLLLYRRAYSSSDENAERIAAFAIDGDEETRWSSVYSDDQWIAVELEEVKTIKKVKLHWEDAYGENYEIQVSQDGADWTTVYHETAGDGGWDEITFDEVEAKHVRMKGNERASEWGFSLFAFQAFSGTDDTSIGGLPAGASAVLIHPNPVENHLIVSFKIPVKDVAFSVYNLSGQKVDASDLKNGVLQNHSLDLSSLEKGFYFLEINIGQHVERHKFVKK